MTNSTWSSARWRTVMEACHFGSRGRGSRRAGGQEIGNGKQTEFFGGGGMYDSSNVLKLDGAWRRTIMRECDMNKRTKKEKKIVEECKFGEIGVGAGDKYNNGKTQKVFPDHHWSSAAASRRPEWRRQASASSEADASYCQTTLFGPHYSPTKDAPSN